MRKTKADDLQLVVAGISSPFVNGGEVPVAGEFMAQLTFAPGDDHYGRNLDVYLPPVSPPATRPPHSLATLHRRR